MRTGHFIAIISRLMALYIFVQYFLLQVALLPFVGVGYKAGFIWWVVVFSLLALVIFLWRFPLALAQHIVPAHLRDKELTTNVTYEQLQVLLCFLLGAFFVAKEMAGVFAFLLHVFDLSVTGWGGHVFSSFIQVMAGLAIMLGGPGLLGLVSKLRNTRYHAPTDPKD